MATTRNATVVTRWSIDHPVHEIFPGLPRQKWKRRSCGDGAHGRRIFDRARVEVRPWHREDSRHWVLARRSVSRPEEISYCIAADPALTTPYPLDVLGAQTQGMIGPLLVRALRGALPGRQVAALVTHTVVRSGDPAFERPTKLVGQVYSREVAHVLARKRGWHIAKDTTGWRRVVPSPAPETIVETDTVRALLSSGTLVVCAGGGGVPGTADRDTGELTGV